MGRRTTDSTFQAIKAMSLRSRLKMPLVNPSAKPLELPSVEQFNKDLSKLQNKSTRASTNLHIQTCQSKQGRWGQLRSSSQAMTLSTLCPQQTSLVKANLKDKGFHSPTRRPKPRLSPTNKLQFLSKLTSPKMYLSTPLLESGDANGALKTTKSLSKLFRKSLTIDSQDWSKSKEQKFRE